jgi:hypothetical protein
MEINKIYTHQLKITNYSDATPESIISLLTNELVGTCFGSAKIMKINEIVDLSKLYSSITENGKMLITVTFSATVKVLKPGDILVHCEIKNRQKIESTEIIELLSDDIAISVQSSVDPVFNKLLSFEVGKFIPIAIMVVGYRINFSRITAIGVPLSMQFLLSNVGITKLNVSKETLSKIDTKALRKNILGNSTDKLKDIKPAFINNIIPKYSIVDVNNKDYFNISDIVEIANTNKKAKTKNESDVVYVARNNEINVLTELVKIIEPKKDDIIYEENTEVFISNILNKYKDNINTVANLYKYYNNTPVINILSEYKDVVPKSV